ncbi:MAG: hypothetical protein IT285_14370 [Bdellovibrionales bacterium]|nr:hypothetical protein [Bdellovibrionales bacterium]
MNLRSLALAALALTLTTATIARAEGEAASTGYIGGLIGLAMSDGNSEMTFGGEVGYHLSPEMALGLYFTTYSPVTDVSVSSLMLFGDYYLADVKGLHLGAMIGLGMSSLPAPLEGTSELGFGARAGYDFDVATGFTVGPEANFILIDGESVINLLAGVSYHF